LRTIFDQVECLKQEYVSEEQQGKELSAFFDKVIEASILA